MRHQSGEIGRVYPPPPLFRLPRSPVSGAPTGHSPQTFQLPELFDLIIRGAKSRVRPIAAGRSSTWPVVLLSLRRADGNGQPQAYVNSSIAGKHSGQWTRELYRHYLSWFLEFPWVSQSQRNLSRCACAAWTRYATSHHGRSGQSQNKLQAWGCLNVDTVV